MLVRLSRRSPDPDRLEANPGIPLGRLFAFLCLFALSTSCSTSTNETVITLDARKGSAAKTLPASPEERQYLLLPFSAPDKRAVGSSLIRITAQVETSSANARAEIARQTQMIRPQTSRLLRRVRREQSRRLRDATALSQVKSLRDLPGMSHVFTWPPKHPAPRQQALADTITLFSPFSGDANGPITGVLRVNDGQTAIYIDSRDNGDISSSDVNALITGFSEITLPRLIALFGSPSDIDRNGRVILFLASAGRFEENELGLFQPADLLPDGAIAGTRSNEREIVFSQLPAEDAPLELIQATLAHEAFHLVNFAQKSLPVYERTGGLLLIQESLFLNEGLAHLTEDLVGWGACTALLTQIYLECLPFTSLAGSGENTVDGMEFCEVVASQSDSLPRRGGMMLFLLYLFQQLGGAQYSPDEPGDLSGTGIAFLRELNTSADTGIANLETASGRSFFSWYSDFGAVMTLDNLNVTTNPRFNFEAEITDPFTKLLRNIRTHGSRIDIDGSLIELGGPATGEQLLSPWETSLFESGTRPLALIVPAHSKLTLTLEGAPSLALGLTLIHLP